MGVERNELAMPRQAGERLQQIADLLNIPIESFFDRAIAAVRGLERDEARIRGFPGPMPTDRKLCSD